MPTSAPGADPDQRGFTLVELMVVIAMLGLMSAIAVMTIPSSDGLSKPAEAFAARLVRAQEEAVMTNRAIAVQVDGDGYGFRRRTPTGWTAFEDGPFKRTAWPEGVSVESHGQRLPAQASFDGAGLAEPLSLTLVRERTRIRIEVDPAGEVRVHAG